MFSSNPNCYIVTNNKLHYYDSFTSSLLLLSYLIINNVPIYKERRLHRAAALCTHCGGRGAAPSRLPRAHRGDGAGRWRRGRGVGQTHVDLKELGRHVYIIIIHISHHFYTSCITHSNKREE